LVSIPVLLSGETDVKSSIVHEPARLANLGEVFELDEVWRCSCSREHNFGMYVAAHWDDELIHNCECGANHVFKSGRVIE